MECLPKDTLPELKKLFEDYKSQFGETGHQDSHELLQKNSVTKLDGILEKLNRDSPDFLKVLSMKASLYYEKAKVCLTKNNLEQTKENLDQGLKLVHEYDNDPQVAFLYLRIVNYLSYVLSRTGELDKARILLEELLKDDIKCEPQVYCTEDLFSNAKVDQTNAKYKVTKLMINNMQMLSWIYGKLGLTNDYAVMVHKTLQKELDVNDGDPVQWAERCFRLASLFLAQNRWQNARYHLAAAQVVLDPLEVTFNPNSTVFKAQADLARTWVNYGLQLFSASKKTILERIWEQSEEQADEGRSATQAFMFKGLEVPVSDVPINEINNAIEAKELFSATYKWLKRARLYYSLRDHPMQYVNIILELSELYRFLSFYEKTLGERYNIQKKRYETLETLSSILKEVRPSCYIAVSIDIIKEIIEVQIEMMNINLKRLYDPDTDANLEEEDLRKRIGAVADISSRIEDMCKEGQNRSCIDIAEGDETEANVTEEYVSPEVKDDGKVDLDKTTEEVQEKKEDSVTGDGEGIKEKQNS